MTKSIAILSQIRQRRAAMPKPEPENSLLLRLLVQALVIVGIVATDVAGETFGTEESVSVWAVPLSIVGAVWSWYRRRERNIPTKFGIALGMLAALAYFLWRLREEFNDTRLVLAGLLIHLQVLHSFDLPRRKDLGYSIAIGLILLGVAATVSQTMAFAPLLLVFLALALPVLVLDYRSRLGLKPLKIKNQNLKTKDSPFFNFKFLIVNFIVILALGLTIFAFLPRLPGYQLRTFPISSPIEFTGSFDGRNVVNPGYRNRGRNNQNERGGTGSGGRNVEDGPGELDPTFYYGFNTKINQNLRGQLEPAVVMRVRSQAEGFWRVLGFDRYTGQGWEISRNDKTFKVDRPWWSYRFYIPSLPTANRTKEVIQSYTIVSDLPNLIPAMAQAEELYFPTQQVAVDTEGGLRSPPQVGLPAGVTYSVVSNVPFRDRTRLGKASTKYPKTIQQYYLQVPPQIQEKVRKLTEEILANKNKVAKDSKPLTSAYEKALYLTQYLKQHPNYKLQKDPPFLAEGEDLVAAFLFGYKNSPPGEKITGGYPDHFSTVLTIMLRSIGIPARLVGGFGSGEFNPFTGFYVVRNTDAYLITEVYFPKYGWFAFDPIPGHPLFPPSVEEDQTFSVLKQFWQWVAGWLPSPVSNFLSHVLGGAITWIMRAIGYFLALFAQGWIGLFTGLAMAIALAFCFWFAWDRWRVCHYRRGLEKLPPMESIYRQMLDILAVKGYRKHPSQTPLEYARTSRQHHDIEWGDGIDEISQAYVRWRYGGESPNIEQLRRRLQDLKKQILAASKKMD
ncbi:DUF3488 and DUF4129 domain-containing transglutaminase family protein [Microseira sp. BLCC-F43]|jgi:transglutaminase-like putative cysteine protease|uniref:transglutaminase TgpA family protein n=1 Tax=Microseira sp. BLCC-F43 TaxID=3153602 RepID=UPI0035B721A9